MRKSVDKKDPGYSEDSYLYDVYLDDKQVHKCVTADEETGEVWFYDVINYDQIKRLTGKVNLIKNDSLRIR